MWPADFGNAASCKRDGKAPVLKLLLRVLLPLAAVSTLAACERLMQDMYDQPRYKAQAPSSLWPDGASARPPEAGTVAFSAGAAAAAAAGRRQETMPGRQTPTANPLPVSDATLARGRQRYDIYCAACHGAAGEGDGIVVQRGFPRPPSLHTDKLRAAPDAYIYTVITNGIGIMYPHADRVAPHDRWAIALYIRALQLSQHATLDDALPAEREQLRRGAR
jgi:mono/diheme cytochrome c family protein